MHLSIYPEIFPIAQIACSEISEKREVRSLQKSGIAPLSYQKRLHINNIVLSTFQERKK